MRKYQLVGMAVIFAAVLAVPAQAQFDGKLSLEPYITYGFFGSLPDTNVDLEGALSFGGRVGYQLAPQWSVFGNYQRSTPDVSGTSGSRDVDHWSLGAEFSYFPRGGAEGMLPVLLEAGLGQARYPGGVSDFAVNLGIASALEVTPNLVVRYGVNDYLSNYGGDGVVNQVFARVGAEFRL